MSQYNPPPQSTSPTGAAGGDLSGTYPSPTIAAGAVTSSKLASGAAAANIGAGAIANSQLANGAVANLSGTNSGDVTIGTANGLSLSGQALSLAAAGAASAGAVTTSAQTFAGAKTFTSPLILDYAGSLTALAGGAQAGTALSHEYNEFTTVATPLDSAQLPAGVSGQLIRRIVKNSTTQPMAVFPQTGSAIGAWATNGFDIVAPQSEREYLNYNASSTWVVRDVIDPQTEFRWEDDFYGLNNAASNGPGNQNWQSFASGSGSSIVAASGDIAAGQPGVVSLNTGTTTSGSAILYLVPSGNGPGIKLGGGVWIRHDWIIYLPSLSTSGDEYAVYLGFSDSSSAEATNGVYAYYDRANDGNFWGIKSATTGGGKVKTNPGTVAVSASTKQHITMFIAPDGSRADLVVNGSYVGAVTSNIPTVTIFPAALIKKSAGTTARKMLVDFMRNTTKFTTSRW